jgi:hypothetical protein
MLAVLVIVGLSAVVATAAPNQNKDRVVMTMGGPTLDLGGGVQYFLDQRTIVMDAADVGKPFHLVKNLQTRDQLARAYTEMYSAVGTPDNANLIAASVLGHLPEAARASIAGPLVAQFKKAQQAGFDVSALDTPIFDDACSLGDVCPGVCGTIMPGGEHYCLTNLACTNCGSIK